MIHHCHTIIITIMITLYCAVVWHFRFGQNRYTNVMNFLQTTVAFRSIVGESYFVFLLEV